MEIKLAALRTVVRELGYTGSDSDGPAMKKFLIDSGATVTGPDGKDVDASKLEIETQRVTIKDDGDSSSKSLTKDDKKEDELSDRAKKDLESIVAKMVQDKVGVDNKQQPGNVDSKKLELSVKTGTQLWYEDRIANKSAAFSTYEKARAMYDYLAAQHYVRDGNLAAAAEHQKNFHRFAETKGYTTTTVSSLIPDQFDSDLINLVKEFGVARRLCKVVRMEGDTVQRPRATGALTVNYDTEGATHTETSRAYGSVQLVAKNGTVYVSTSLPASEDAAIALIEDNIREGMRAIAKVEDATLFNGDGSGVAGGFIPMVNGFAGVFGTTATTDSRSVTGGDTSDAHTRANILTLMGKVPMFVGGFPAWHCSYEMGAMLLNAAQSQGGATVAEFAGFGILPTLFNRPVVYNNVMNTNFNTGGDIVDVYYGDVSQAAYFGDRLAPLVEVSDHALFPRSQRALRIRVRHDITVHDLGSTSTQSPVAALFQT